MRYPNSLQQPRKSREHCCRENHGVVDNVDAAGEPDLAVWSLDKCFEQLRFAETVLDRILAGPL